MYCNQCGARADDDARFCPRCGSRLSPGLAPLEQPPTPKERPPELPAEEPAAQSTTKRGCSWAMGAGMVAGVAILVMIVIAGLAIWQGYQERARINRSAAADHYQKGLEYLNRQAYDLARAEFEIVLQLNPAHKEAATKLAEAQAHGNAQPTPSPQKQQDIVLLYNEARQAYNDGDWATVLAKLQQVQNLDPNYDKETVTTLLAEAYYKSGLELVEQNRMEEAVRFFNRSEELRPGNPDVYEQKRLASLYLAGMNYWGANWLGVIENLSVLHELRPDYKDVQSKLQEAHIAYADILLVKGEWCTARDHYASAVAIRPRDDIEAKRRTASDYCAAAPASTGTPAPSGTFVGRLVRVEHVGQHAMMIRGTILDEMGKPMPGVRVGLSAWDWKAPPATANENGVFAFDGLGNPVTYTVTIEGMATVPLQVKTDWDKLVWVEFRRQP